MRQPDLDLLHAYLDDRLSSVDHAALHALLRGSPEARRTLRGLATVDAKLEQLAAGDPDCLRQLMPSDHGPLAGTNDLRRALGGSRSLAAVAGLLLGVSCTSIVFAYVASSAKVRTIFAESFETGRPPLTSGMPIEPDVWGGDYSAVVEADERVTPADGRAMLRFLRADHEGKPPRLGYVGDIYRIIELHDFAADIADGNSHLVMEARFASSERSQPNRFRFGIGVDTMFSLPSSGGEHEMLQQIATERLTSESGRQLAEQYGPYSPASVQRGLVFAEGRGSWQPIQVALQVTPGTRYLLVKLYVADLQPAAADRDTGRVEFTGLFVDDIRVTLTKSPVQR